MRSRSLLDDLLVLWRRPRQKPRADLTFPWDVMEDPPPDYLVQLSVVAWECAPYVDQRVEAIRTVRRLQAWVMAPDTDAAREERGLAVLSALALTEKPADKCAVLESFYRDAPDVTVNAWQACARRYREG